jgi:hypothetical protein
MQPTHTEYPSLTYQIRALVCVKDIYRHVGVWRWYKTRFPDDVDRPVFGYRTFTDRLQTSSRLLRICFSLQMTDVLSFRLQMALDLSLPSFYIDAGSLVAPRSAQELHSAREGENLGGTFAEAQRERHGGGISRGGHCLMGNVGGGRASQLRTYLWSASVADTGKVMHRLCDCVSTTLFSSCGNTAPTS